MKRNYHTHTPRCNHATGTEREYIETAIDRGLEVLGFSDHSPYIFDGDYYSDYRMWPSQAEDYIKTVRKLALEFKKSITVLAGMEMEYYPGIFERTLNFIGNLDCDYLILGQHFAGVERRAATRRGKDEAEFHDYVSQVIDGMETGVFIYLAHPDVWNFDGDDAVREREYLRLCEAAKRLDMPVEINMLGLSAGRHYPQESFFKIAASVGNEVVLGCDAHQPYRVADPDEIQNAHEFAARCGVIPVELTVERVLSKKKLIK